MKKIFRNILLLIILVITFVGCSLQKNNDDTNKNNIMFSKMSQDKKCDYVTQYLKNTYGISCTITNEIKRRSAGVIYSEEYYYAIAKLDNNDRIYCWISEDGMIIDSKFILDMSDSVNELFRSKISDGLGEFAIKCVVTPQNAPSKTWSAENAAEMLSAEDVFTNVIVFLKPDKKPVVEEKISDGFDGSLNFTNGTICFYYVNDLSESVINGSDLTKYDNSFDFKKER